MTLSLIHISLLTITDHIGEKKEISSILVDRGSPGYYTEPVKGKLVWRAIDNGNLRFENCRVPQKNLLGRREMCIRDSSD